MRGGYRNFVRKPTMRSWRNQNFYSGLRTNNFRYRRMDTRCHATFHDERTVYATFCSQKPAASRNDVYQFFLSNYGDVIHSIRMDEQNPPLHAWITFHSPEVAKGVLGEGPLPLKKWMLGGKSIWLKPSIL